MSRAYWIGGLAALAGLITAGVVFSQPAKASPPAPKPPRPSPEPPGPPGPPIPSTGMVPTTTIDLSSTKTYAISAPVSGTFGGALLLLLQSPTFQIPFEQIGLYPDGDPPPPGFPDAGTPKRDRAVFPGPGIPNGVRVPVPDGMRAWVAA